MWMKFQKYWVISNSDFSGEFSLDNDHQINHLSVVYELGLEKENGEVIFSFNFLSDPLAKTDPKNEEEEKRLNWSSARETKTQGEKNSEKYGDGYRFVLSSQKLDSLKNCF